MLLTILAIVMQSLDGISTCNGLNSGNFKELNPIMGRTCKDVVIRKLVIATPLLVLNKKNIKIGLISAGTIGFTWNITR